MRLAQDRSAAQQARRHARQCMRDLALNEFVVADIELVVGELVNNAVLHATPPYDFDLFCANGTVRGEVHDCSTARPAVNAGPDHRGGFGLNIVAARTSRWGSKLTAAGKQVWFEIDQP
ncbi:MAG: ATP-binding protein [Acidimicrobiales bacterium]